MRKLIEVISDLILPALVLAAVAAILTGAALLGRIGSRMETESEDFSHMADTQAVEKVCQRKAPLIECVGKKVWSAGQSIPLSQVFSAVDEEGKALELVISDITDQNGDSVLHCYQESSGQAVFSQRGIYIFSLKAMDTEQKISEEKQMIFVDDR